MMWSSSPVCARPVRTLPRSALNAWMLLSIFCSVCFFRSAITNAIAASRFGQSYVNQRALVLAENHAAQRVFLEDAEYIDRQLLVAAQRERGGVHHLQVARNGLVEADLRIALRGRVALRVSCIDAVDLRALQHDLRAHLAAAQRGGGVGGEKG